jgi:hypothetical protein
MVYHRKNSLGGFGLHVALSPVRFLKFGFESLLQAHPRDNHEGQEGQADLGKLRMNEPCVCEHAQSKAPCGRARRLHWYTAEQEVTAKHLHEIGVELLPAPFRGGRHGGGRHEIRGAFACEGWSSRTTSTLCTVLVSSPLAICPHRESRLRSCPRPHLQHSLSALSRLALGLVVNFLRKLITISTKLTLSFAPYKKQLRFSRHYQPICVPEYFQQLCLSRIPKWARSAVDRVSEEDARTSSSWG